MANSTTKLNKESVAMPSLENDKKLAPLVYIGPARRVKTEQAAMSVGSAFGRVMTSSKLIQGLIDRYLDIYVNEITARKTK